MDLSGKVALVTGASRGIGRQIALAFAREGVSIVAAARSVTAHASLPGTIGETIEEIRKAGGQAIAVQADVSKIEELPSLIGQAISAFGRIDILVNNAAEMVGSPLGIEVYPMDNWLGQFDTNVHAPFKLMSLVSPYMITQGGGIIINLSSKAGDLVERDLSKSRGIKPAGRLGSRVGYNTTKAALNALTNALAPELAAHNIAAICLDPGVTRTERFNIHYERGDLNLEGSHPMNVPVTKALEIVLSDNPLAYAGKVIRA